MDAQSITVSRVLCPSTSVEGPVTKAALFEEGHHDGNGAADGHHVDEVKKDLIDATITTTAAAPTSRPAAISLSIPTVEEDEGAVLLAKDDDAAATKAAAAGATAAGAGITLSGVQVPESYEAAGESLAAASAYVLQNLVFRTSLPDPTTAKRIANETVGLWNTSINPGFLQYRKSVAEAEDFAALEWSDDASRPGGCTLIDHRGNQYIDLLGGFGIYSCGHSHPKIIAAVQAQLVKQPLHSQELLDPLRAYAASLLKKTMPPGELRDNSYVFFTNSGTESVEACLKFAMLRTNRRNFIGVVGAFHGKTMGSLSGTSKAVFRKPFAGMGALLPFQHVKLNDTAALRATFEASKFNGNEIAAFIVEPVIGEGGIHICSNEFLQEARKLCTEYGALMIADEVQSGMGRTGKFWACEHAGVVPDLMAIAKGFGGGVMGAGAAIGTKNVMEPLFENPFIHTTTFGGNPLACTAAIAAMHVTETENLAGNAATKGDWLLSKLNELKARYPHIIKEARGRGLMLGLEFWSDEIGYSFSKAVMSRGILLSGTLIAARVLRVEPPLTITQEEVEIVAERMEASLLAMTCSGIASAPENVPASLRGVFNSTPEAAFVPALPAGHTISAGAHINPAANNGLTPPSVFTGFGGPGLSPSAQHVSSPVHTAYSGFTHSRYAPAAHGAATATATAAAASAPAPVSAPAPAVPAAASPAPAAAAEDDEDDEVGTVQHHLAQARAAKNKRAAARRSTAASAKSSSKTSAAASPAAATSPKAASASASASAPIMSADEASKLAVLRELDGGAVADDESSSSTAVSAAAAAPAAAGSLAAAAPASSSHKAHHHHHHRHRHAHRPHPAQPAQPAGGPGVAAPGFHPHEDEDEDDDEEEESEEEDESDVSSVSSTSTESGGMDDEDAE